jgi:hypothetical protein
MDIERMRREAQEFAQFRLEKIEEAQAVMTARDIAEAGIRSRRAAELDARLEAEEQEFEKLRPQLEEQARKEHQERFRPLQQLLEPFRTPFLEVRDAYFPDSKIAVVDHYDNSYHSDWGQNVYYRGFIASDDGGFTDQGTRLFGVYAVAIDDRNRGEIIYGIDISVSYKRRTPQAATQDFQYITPDKDLFTVDRGQFFFNSSHSTPDYSSIRGRERIEYKRGDDGSFIYDPHWRTDGLDTVIERRFMGVIKRIEVDNILVKNGHGFHSQFSSLEGASFE